MEYMFLSIALVTFFIIVTKYFPKYKNKNISYQKNNIDNQKINLILNTDFKTSPLMNKEEYKVYMSLQNLLFKEYKQKYLLFPQVGLGGFIKTLNDFNSISQREKKAFWAIGYLRADFLIIDAFGNPVLVIEYQGNGHYINNNTTERDTRKRVVCEKVGIRLIEIFSYYKNEDENKIKAILDNYFNKKHS